MKLGTNDIGSVYLGTNAVQKVYLGTNEVWTSSDPDADAFFARVTTAGGTLSATEQSAINTLVKQMKDDGIWTKMKAIYPMVGASAAACAQNLKSSSFTGTFTSGWTFASTGVTPNATSAYMDTGLNDNTDLQLNSTHLSYYCRLNSFHFCLMGCTDNTNYTQLIPKFSSDVNDYSGIHGSQSGTNSGITDNKGHFIISRLNDTTLKSYQNGSNNVTKTNSSVNKVNLNIYIGGRNRAGSLNSPTANECAFASIGDGLTDGEADDFYTAVQAFQETLNRDV